MKQETALLAIVFHNVGPLKFLLQMVAKNKKFIESLLRKVSLQSVRHDMVNTTTRPRPKVWKTKISCDSDINNTNLQKFFCFKWVSCVAVMDSRCSYHKK